MAIKILYENEETITEDLEDAAEIIVEGLACRFKAEIPIAIIDLSTGEPYRCRWSVTLVPQYRR